MPIADPAPCTARPLADLLSAAAIPYDSMSDLARVAIAHVTDDSRDVRPATAFVAHRGIRSDGRDFITAAVAAGARAVLTDAAIVPNVSAVVVRVPDPASAHARLVAEVRGLRAVQRAGTLRVVGVTGTNGKSTTVHLLRDILETADHPTALVGTIYYVIGSERQAAPWTTPPAGPLTDLLLDAHGCGAGHAVMEVSSHALDQRRVDGVRFEVGVFTNLTGDHLDYHRDRSAYLAAKRRLFQQLPDDGTAIINADDPASEAMIHGCRARVWRVAVDRPADFRAADIACTITGTCFTLIAPDHRLTVRWPWVGRHNVANALGAVAAARALGVSWSAIAAALSSPQPVPGRLQAVHPPDHPFAVFVDYAHTDDALTHVLGALRPLTPGRLWCVFGCGGDRDRSKRPRMAAVAARYADCIIVTNDNPRSETPQAIAEDILRGFGEAGRPRATVELDRAAAIAQALDRARPDDVVLIAGKGHEDYQLIADQRLHFDDAAVARALLTRGRGVVES